MSELEESGGVYTEWQKVILKGKYFSDMWVHYYIHTCQIQTINIFVGAFTTTKSGAIKLSGISKRVFEMNPEKYQGVTTYYKRLGFYFERAGESLEDFKLRVAHLSLSLII